MRPSTKYTGPPDRLKDEQRLHKRLGKYHVRGDWYELPGKLAVRLLMLDTLDNIR